MILVLLTNTSQSVRDMIVLSEKEWEWMVAGAAPGLQIRVSGRKTFRGVFDSHAFPPLVV